MKWGAAAAAVSLAAVVFVALRFFENPPPEKADDVGDGRVAEITNGGPGVNDIAIDVSSLTPTEVTELAFRGLPVPGCEDSREKRDDQLVRFEPEELARQSVESLRGSADVDMALAAALLEHEVSAKKALVDEAYTLDSDNPLAVWNRLQVCALSDIECDWTSMEAVAVSVDGSNGMVWYEIAGRHIRNENWSEAQAALQRATSAARFDLYFIEHALLVERGLAATSELSYAERVVFGIGISAAVAIPYFGDVARACSSEPEEAQIDVAICFHLGEHMAEASRDLITTMIGYSIWRNSAARMGDEVLADRIDRKKDDVHASVVREQAASGALALLENDSSVLQRYVDNYLARGEIQASAMLVEEAKRLRQDSGYDQCNFVGNPDFLP